MKKTILLAGVFVMSFITNYCFAQDYQGLLTNGTSKTWLLSDLSIGGKHFDDTDSSCFYQITLTFKADGTFSKTIPCATTTPTETGVFNIFADSLTFSNYTMKITSITNTQFEAFYFSSVSGKYASSKKIQIYQRYQAQ